MRIEATWRVDLTQLPPLTRTAPLESTEDSNRPRNGSRKEHRCARRIGDLSESTLGET